MPVTAAQKTTKPILKRDVDKFGSLIDGPPGSRIRAIHSPECAILTQIASEGNMLRDGGTGTIEVGPGFRYHGFRRRPQG